MSVLGALVKLLVDLLVELSLEQAAGDVGRISGSGDADSETDVLRILGLRPGLPFLGRLRRLHVAFLCVVDVGAGGGRAGADLASVTLQPLLEKRHRRSVGTGLRAAFRLVATRVQASEDERIAD